MVNSPASDAKKQRLSLAPAAVTLDGEAATGWTLVVTNASAVFAFLKKQALAGTKVHMSVSYAIG